MSPVAARAFRSTAGIAMFAICGIVIAHVAFAQEQTKKPVRLAHASAYTNVPYRPDGDARAHKLDVYVPNDLPADARLPVIVWIHSGGWFTGDKAPCPILPFTRAGYVVASINYRFSKQGVFPAQLDDCKAAIRFLRAHADQYHIDPKRVGVWGASAGGHLAALLGTTDDEGELAGDDEHREHHSARVQAVCDFFGPADFTALDGDLGTTAHRQSRGMVAQLLGGPISQRMDLARLASPVTHATKDDAPTFIVHGRNDWIVPLDQSQRLHKALKAADVPVTFMIIEKAGHGGKGIDDNPRLLQAIAGFFNEHLKTPAAADESSATTDKQTSEPATR